MPLPKGPWDDLRRKIEEVLGLPPGSTIPGKRPPPISDLTKNSIAKLGGFLKKR